VLRILYRSLLSDKNLGIDTHFAGELLFSVAVYLEEIIWRIHKYLVERRKKQGLFTVLLRSIINFVLSSIVVKMFIMRKAFTVATGDQENAYIMHY
jgi:hypothetical protein